MGNRNYPAEAYELMEWAYADGCTPTEVQRVVSDFYGPIPYSAIYSNKPEVRERIREHMCQYRQRLEVRERMCQYRQRPEVREHMCQYRQRLEVREHIHERMHQKSEEQWRAKKEASPRYTCTGKGEDFIRMGMLINGGFEDGMIMTFLRVLGERPMNEYELVEHFRDIGDYVTSVNRGYQVSAVKKSLRGLMDGELVRPA